MTNKKVRFFGCAFRTVGSLGLEAQFQVELEVCVGQGRHLYVGDGCLREVGHDPGDHQHGRDLQADLGVVGRADVDPGVVGGHLGYDQRGLGGI